MATASKETVMETERLKLVRMTDSSKGSKHLEWFHRLWSDEGATSWSLRGATKSYEDSQEWMQKNLGPEIDEIMWAVFTRPSPSTTSSAAPTEDDDANFIGIVGLRKYPTFFFKGPPLPNDKLKTADGEQRQPSEFRMVGYSFIASSWGHGYATEAGQAVLSNYAESGGADVKGKRYVEAAVDRTHQASIRVLEKLGLRKVGWHEEEGRLLIGGQWREKACWVYGVWL
ncbi:hypothetical protein GQ43DRAFT_436274 [Delitschia confertaspora ATCC 74209]|uniref:N-acetyltransferase domain-containing protein n=1 Tax=Delitschia confertaspora ATCC 74209 TaxID=1513339 RepID=A0A9P4JE26_9PLEO|nr:hypothetical protein GQ43DRAFT_436274 [Delitschia confertaspora ATCC 74209]